MKSPIHGSFSLLLVFATFFPVLSTGQDEGRIRLLGAHVIEYDSDIVDAQRLIGKVSFAHADAKLYCDSAWLYESDNDLKAFGNVRIVQEGQQAPKDKKNSQEIGSGKVTINADSLYYKGNDRVADLYQNVVLRDEAMTLTTDLLTYSIDDRTGSYYGGGKIISQENNNVLTSEIGRYYAEGKIFHFKKDVLLVNPQYTIVTDTLHYHSISEQSFFLGPTEIQAEQDLIYCENGWYDSMNDIAQFEDNAYIWSNKQQLKGDSLYYDRNKAVGEAFGDVALVDTTNSITIFGQYGRYLENKDIGMVTDSALMVQYFETDTMHMRADTLLAVPDPNDSLGLGSKNIRAYYDVRIFKPDLQGSCDSLTYSETDSLIVMYRSPVVWSEENQISGDRIELLTADGSIDRLYTRGNAFIISEVDTIHYNQIKGKMLTGYFKNNELYRALIEGNGEAVYFAVEETESGNRIIGVNKSSCSDILIHIIDNEIDKVNFMVEPESAFYPLSKIEADALRLKNFNWAVDRRPMSVQDLFSTRLKAEAPADAQDYNDSEQPSRSED